MGNIRLGEGQNENLRMFRKGGGRKNSRLT